MPIVAEFGPDVQEYVEFGKECSCPRPGNCPICGASGQIVGHGYYVRKPKGWDRGWVIRVKRWKCKVCKHTVGAVPTFLLFFRHYLLEIIQSVVVGRFELGHSWTEAVVWSSNEGTPALRTMQRWCVSFAGQASEWLGAVEETLAEQPVSAGRLYLKVEAHGQAYSFYVAIEPDEWRPIAEAIDGRILSTPVAGGFVAITAATAYTQQLAYGPLAQIR